MKNHEISFYYKSFILKQSYHIKKNERENEMLRLRTKRALAVTFKGRARGVYFYL